MDSNEDDWDANGYDWAEAIDTIEKPTEPPENPECARPAFNINDRRCWLWIPEKQAWFAVPEELVF